MLWDGDQILDQSYQETYPSGEDIGQALDLKKMDYSALNTMAPCLNDDKVIEGGERE